MVGHLSFILLFLSFFCPLILFVVAVDPNHHHHKASNDASHTNVLCELPSLPHDSVHIIVAGHQPGDFSDHYLVQSGLSNARVIFYRRVDYDKTPSQVNGSCGIIAEERILNPNRGREAAAFYDYAIEHYHNPPKMMVFLHGHAFNGDHPHNTCLGSFSRILHYYRSVMANSSFSRMITLTQKMPKSLPFSWVGAAYDRRRLRTEHESLTNISMTNHPPLPETTTSEPRTTTTSDEKRRHRRLQDEVTEAAKECVNIFVKNKVAARAPGTIPTHNKKDNRVQFHKDIKTDGTTPGYMRSCCSTFVMTGERLRWYPLQFYQDMKAYFLNETINDQAAGWVCFEYVIWDLFADVRGPGATDWDRFEPEKVWYDEANKLSVHTKNSVIHGTSLQKCIEEEREVSNKYMATLPYQ